MPKKSVIIAKYSELVLKSKSTRTHLEAMLIQNIKATLGKKCVVTKEGGVMIVEAEQEQEAMEKLSRVFGLTHLSQCRRLSSEIQELEAAAAEQAREYTGSFAVRATRSEKKGLNSEELGRIIGAAVVKAHGLKVNLDSPDHEIFVYVRGNKAFISSKSVECAGGMPLACQGRMVMLVSGPNSALAAWLLMRRGVTPHFAYTTTKKKEAETALQQLSKWHEGREFKKTVIDFKELEDRISSMEPALRKILFQRALLRAARKICGKKADGIVTGHIPGAECRLEALACVDSAITPYTVHHPLSGFSEEMLDEFRTVSRMQCGKVSENVLQPAGIKTIEEQEKKHGLTEIEEKVVP